MMPFFASPSRHRAFAAKFRASNWPRITSVALAIGVPPATKHSANFPVRAQTLVKPQSPFIESCKEPHRVEGRVSYTPPACMDSVAISQLNTTIPTGQVGNHAPRCAPILRTFASVSDPTHRHPKSAHTTLSTFLFTRHPCPGRHPILRSPFSISHLSSSRTYPHAHRTCASPPQFHCNSRHPHHLSHRGYPRENLRTCSLILNRQPAH